MIANSICRAALFDLILTANLSSHKQNWICKRHHTATLALWFFLQLTGCASPQTQTQPHAITHSDDTIAFACRAFYATLEKAITSHSVRDAQTDRITGFPYLHVNRFYASFRGELQHPDAFAFWVERLRLLAARTHSNEIANLPTDERERLFAIRPETPKSHDLSETLAACGKVLIENDLSKENTRQVLIEKAVVHDDYKTWYRVFGVYPVTAVPFALGINQWHEESRADFSTPRDQLPVHGVLTQYALPRETPFTSAQQVATVLRQSKQNVLEIPLPTDGALRRLFATFAPVWEVDTVDDNDKIGAPQWTPTNSYAQIDTERANLYTLMSHTRFGDANLLQLNYVIWFPSRPCASYFDLLCGHIDSVIWRVTLGNNGNALAYDSIHSCGCYHTFIPTGALQQIVKTPTLQEEAFVPITAAEKKFTQRFLLRIAHSSHYVQGLFIAEDSDKDVSLHRVDYETLRSLSFARGERKSLFESNALIAGSDRGERWFFWPMGVPSAGAMRQWGNHATAFVGRRHFDDPFLFQDAFRNTPRE
jgi:hypothetical protein